MVPRRPAHGYLTRAAAEGARSRPLGQRHRHESPGRGKDRKEEEEAPVAMGLEAARELECAALGTLLRDPREAERTLLLDCRPFLAFCRRHVRAARPVPWNALLRRRARGPPAAVLACLLPDRALRTRLVRGELARAVVLDEGSASVAELRPDSPAHVLLAALLHETRAGPTAVYFLRGGFDGFQGCCPDLCSEAPAPALPPTGDKTSRSDSRAPVYDQGGPVEILPYLFLGSCSHSSDLQGLQACGITAVLNVSASCPNHFEGLFRYKSIPVEDNQMVEISAWFQEAIGFIDWVKNSGGRVLVHCQAGISRSATICLAYLMQSRRVRLDEAFDFVKQRRGVISPNFSFMGQLLQFETQVLCH
ncbi:dual specificity protein phosphatase 2 isoform X3 [Homo sapiens]|nr:dual specificity protein phosphatase 2 isoform X3 [Homo sapiens]